MAGLFLIIVIVIVIAMVGASTQQSTTTSGNESFRRVAQAHRFRYSPGTLFRNPRMLALAEGHEIVISLVPWQQLRSKIYEAEMNWPAPKLRMTIHSQNTWARRNNVSVGNCFTSDSSFDRLFAVDTNDPRQAVATLTEGARWHLIALLRLNPRGTLTLETEQNRVRIRLQYNLGGVEELDAFTRGCIGFLEQLLTAQMKGIEFVAPMEATIIDDAICQVCGDEIHADLVFCRSCKTPHHEDCWQYNGTCSTYGCSETVCERPRMTN